MLRPFSAKNRRVRVIALNGTSTAGSPRWSRAMQHQFAAQGQCWVILGIDDFLGKLPAPWVRYHEAGAHAELAAAVIERRAELDDLRSCRE